MFQEVGQKDKGKRVADVMDQETKREKEARTGEDRRGKEDARGLTLCC